MTAAPPPAGDGPLAVLQIPAGAGRAAATMVRAVVAVGLGFATVCLVGAVGLLFVGGAEYALVLVAAKAFWLLVAAGGWAYGRRTLRTPGATGGTVLGAVWPDAVDVGGGLVLPMSEVEEVGLFWFAIRVRGRAVGLGGAVADAAITAAHESAGGNLGVAAVVRPRDPQVLRTPARPGTAPTRIREDPLGRPVAVLTVHRATGVGDPLPFARALSDVARMRGVPVGGAPTPPPEPPELAAWLR